jgi:hypothetical protein
MWWESFYQRKINSNPFVLLVIYILTDQITTNFYKLYQKPL